MIINREKPPTQEELLSIYIRFKELAQILSDLEAFVVVLETVLSDVARITQIDFRNYQGRDIYSTLFPRLSHIDAVLVELSEIKHLRTIIVALNIRDDLPRTPLVSLILIKGNLFEIEDKLNDRFPNLVTARSPIPQLVSTIETLIGMVKASNQI